MSDEPICEDMKLWQRWVAGDNAAANVLINRHYRAVARFFASKVPEDAVADLVQETFGICTKVHARFRWGSKFRTFLFGIAFNVFRKYLARLRPEEPTDMERLTAVAVMPSAWAVVADQQQARVLLEALRSIPLSAQIVLELYYWEKLSAREIGEVFARPEGTIRNRIRRAKLALEEALAEVERRAHELSPTLTDIDAWAVAVAAQRPAPAP